MFSSKILTTALQVSKPPFYLYSEELLLAQCKAALSMPSPFGHKVRFAIKAAPNANLLRLMQNQGIHFDASSEWEALRMLHVGIAGNRIMLTAQQTAANPEHLLARGVILNACSLHQMECYAPLSAQKKMPMALRVNPGEDFNFPFKTNVSGKNSSFGIWHEQLGEAIKIANSTNARIETLHSHIGSGSSENPWVEATKLTLQMLTQMPHVKTLNIGGGFKVDRYNIDHSDLQKVGNAVTSLLLQHQKNTNTSIKLEIEPGTFLVASTAALVTCIDDIVNTGEKGYTFCKLNAGMNDYIRSSMYGAKHRFYHYKKTSVGLQAANEQVQQKNKKKPQLVLDAVVVGHCCENGDVFTPASRNDGTPPMEPIALTNPQIGDLLVLNSCGAYGASMSSNYNSFPLIPELFLKPDGKVTLIRKKQLLEQIIANETVVIA